MLPCPSCVPGEAEAVCTELSELDRASAGRGFVWFMAACSAEPEAKRSSSESSAGGRTALLMAWAAWEEKSSSGLGLVGSRTFPQVVRRGLGLVGSRTDPNRLHDGTRGDVVLQGTGSPTRDA